MTVVSIVVGEVMFCGKELEKSSWKNIWAGISKEACDSRWSLGAVVICLPHARSRYQRNSEWGLCMVYSWENECSSEQEYGHV